VPQVLIRTLQISADAAHARAHGVAILCRHQRGEDLRVGLEAFLKAA
jgi:hypothetical protein